MALTTDVVIVGAGIVGCSTAYELARAGVKCLVIDRQEAGREASSARARVLTHTGPGHRVGRKTFHRKDLRSWVQPSSGLLGFLAAVARAYRAIRGDRGSVWSTRRGYRADGVGNLDTRQLNAYADLFASPFQIRLDSS